MNVNMPFETTKHSGVDVEQLRKVLGLDKCRLRPYDHQVLGIEAILGNAFFALFDEMGAGKTLQTLVAAQLLFLAGAIRNVIIFAPASVRGVWFDHELGEIRKHAFEGLNYLVTEFHSKSRTWYSEPFSQGRPILRFIVTNYEFIGRSKQKQAELLAIAGSGPTFLVLDESSAIKNYRAHQTKACFAIRAKCARVLLLNGTPISNNPIDLFTQGNILHPSVLDCKYITHYRARYAVMEARTDFPKITGWKNLDDLQRRLAPYVMRRLKKDCLDLPEKLPPVQIPVPLTENSWSLYRQMRDDLVAYIEASSVSTATHAAIKSLRLAQITSGFLGGIVEEPLDEEPDEETAQAPSFVLPFGDVVSEMTPAERKAFAGPIQEIGREKLAAFMAWWELALESDPSLKLLVFGRFRPEVDRLVAEARKTFRGDVGMVVGGQKKTDRANALRLLDPRTAPEGPALVVGTYGTGAKGLTLTACHTIVNVSYDYSLEKSLQSADRIHRPSQTSPCSFYDLVATGPKGQKTIDHLIVSARSSKEGVANWTQAAWVSALREE